MGIHCSSQNQAYLLCTTSKVGGVRLKRSMLNTTSKYKNKLCNSDETDEPKVVGTSSHIGFLNLRLVEFKYASLAGVKTQINLGQLK